MRGRVRAALAALITAATLTATACGQHGEQAVRAPSPTAEAPAAARAAEAEQPASAAPIEADYDDLVAALPDVAELAPWHLHTRCVVRTFDCAEQDGALIALINVEGRESERVPESAWVSAHRYTTARAAARWLRGRRTTLIDEVRGRIDVAHTEADDRGRYSLGVRGRGTLVDTRLGAWRGIRSSAHIRYQRSDGQLTDPLRYVQIILVRGRYVAQVNVKMLTPPLDEPASALAQRLVTGVVDHLEGGTAS